MCIWTNHMPLEIKKMVNHESRETPDGQSRVTWNPWWPITSHVKPLMANHESRETHDGPRTQFQTHTHCSKHCTPTGRLCTHLVPRCAHKQFKLHTHKVPNSAHRHYIHARTHTHGCTSFYPNFQPLHTKCSRPRTPVVLPNWVLHTIWVNYTPWVLSDQPHNKNLNHTTHTHSGGSLVGFCETNRKMELLLGSHSSILRRFKLFYEALVGRL